MNSPVDELTRHVQAKFPGIPLQHAQAKAEELWSMPAFRVSYVWLVSPNRYQSRDRINPFVAEFLAQAVMRRLGIRTASELFICTAEQAGALSDDFVVKFDRNGRARTLSWNPGATPTGWCLVSKVVRDAASLIFVTRMINKSYPARHHDVRADKFYAEFNPSPAEIDRIKLAMALDGVQYLSIAIARVFLGCTCTPHFGNILVTKAGELISIDHTNAEFEDGEELRQMFHFIDRDSKLFKILGGVASLTEGDIRASVDEIPKHPACGSTALLGDYFVKRLRLWKELHAR
jgi:hypothetical protein